MTMNPQPLELTMFPSVEGIGLVHGLRTFEGMMTTQELVLRFPVEANSDQLDEGEKMQRDVESSRVKGMKSYLTTRKDTLLPNICIFVTQLDVVETVKVGQREVVVANLPVDAETLIADGQGRTTTLGDLLAEGLPLGHHTMAYKLIETGTDTILEARDLIRQAFADLNGQTKKPNSSISLHYDQAKPFSRLLSTLLEMELESTGEPLQKVIALNGRIKQGQVWTHKQLCDLVCKFLGATATEANKTLADEEHYAATLGYIQSFLQGVMRSLPLHLLQMPDWAETHKESLWTKALFGMALGWLGRSMVDDALLMDSEVDWSALEKVTELPLHTLDEELWLKHEVALQDQVKKRNVTVRVVKILKGSDKKIARVLCRHLRVQPVLEL